MSNGTGSESPVVGVQCAPIRHSAPTNGLSGCDRGRDLGWRVLGATAMCLTFGCSTLPAAEARSASAHGDLPQRNEAAKQVFLVTSDATPRRAWFVLWDQASGQGVFYDPPSRAPLSKVELSTELRVFHFGPGIGDVNYILSLPSEATTASRLQGTLQLFDPNARPKRVETTLVTARPIALGGRSPCEGVYSNAEINEESGDLVGTELTLTSAHEGAIGMFIDYVEHDQSLALAGRIEPMGTFKVQALDSSGQLQMSGTCSADSIQLRLYSNLEPNSPKDYTLRRRSGIVPWLEKR